MLMLVFGCLLMLGVDADLDVPEFVPVGVDFDVGARVGAFC